MVQTLADTAYEQLLGRIYSLEFQSGDRLVEQQLTQMLDIGRTPLRQAIQRLASDGLVDLNPGTFATIHTFTEKEVQDYGIVRLSVDVTAAPLVILNGSNLDFQNLLSITTECQKAFERNDIMERIRLDYEFHQQFVAISGNQELTSIQEQMTKRGRLMQLQKYIKEGSSFCDLSGHLDILRALNERNTEDCIRAIKEHLSHSYNPESGKSVEWESVSSSLGMLYTPSALSPR